MKMQTLDDLLYTGLTYVQDFEKKISQQATKMAQASTNTELKQTFEKTASKSGEYAERIQQSFKALGREPMTNDNTIAAAMIEEVENMISNTDPSPVRDAALITAANQQQLYRVSSYGSLATYAKLLGKSDAVAELQKNLDDSKGGDEKLTNIAETQVNQQALQGEPAHA